MLLATIAALASCAGAAAAQGDTWFSATPMSEPRAAQTATLLPDGRVLVVGGYNGFVAGVGGGHTSLKLAELFNANADTWTKAAPMLVARSSQTATLLHDGRVLVIGGWEAPYTSEDSTAEIYDPASNTWSPAPVPEELHEVSSATLLPSGWVFLVGRFGPTEYEATPGAALYDPASGTWERTAVPKHPREGTTTVLLANGNVLMFGGWTSEQRFPPVETVYTILPTTEEYDPNTNEWSEVAAMNQPRARTTATLLPNGDVFTSGGVDKLGISVPYPAYGAVGTAELFDPTTGTWTTLASMNLAREGHTATLLPGGDVLVAGGGDCGSGFCVGFGGSGNCCGASSAELYEPSTNSWSFTAPVLSGVQHTATLLPEGSVLVTGGNLEPINMYELNNAAIYASSYPPDEPHAVAGPAPIVPAAATPAPVISNLRQTHASWRDGDALAHSSANRGKPPVGTSFSFALNEQAYVELTFARRVAGRRARGKCVATTRGNRHGPTCERKVTAGALSLSGRSGTNSVSFQGRLSRSKKLGQGRYALQVIATNAKGMRSAPKSLGFTIVK